MLKFAEHKMINSDEYRAVVEFVALEVFLEDECHGSVNEAWETLNNEMITENKLVNQLNSVLNKAGISISKGHEKGLISDLMTAGKAMFKFIMAAIKGDKATIKKMANTEISKEELAAFILKLDTATGHILSAPIHTINAITGWHIGANLHHAAHEIKNVTVSKIRDAIDFIKHKISTSAHAKADKFAKAVQNLEKKLDNKLLDA